MVKELCSGGVVVSSCQQPIEAVLQHLQLVIVTGCKTCILVVIFFVYINPKLMQTVSESCGMSPALALSPYRWCFHVIFLLMTTPSNFSLSVSTISFPSTPVFLLVSDFSFALFLLLITYSCLQQHRVYYHSAN